MLQNFCSRRSTASAVAVLLLAHTANSFTVVTTSPSTTTTRQLVGLQMESTPIPESDGIKDNQFLKEKSLANPELGAEPRANPDRPELPEIPGDYDWDAKYAQDADWVTASQDIPGKQVLNEIDLAAQISALDRLEEKWRKERAFDEYEQEKKVGFVGKAELLNGRTAMFFLVTGLLTEYWTGISMPGQVEEMLRLLGVIGFE